MKILLTGIVSLALLIGQCGSAPKQTTLDRLGASIVAGIGVFETAGLDSLLANKVISQAKHDALIKKADAAKAKAQEFQNYIGSLAVIRPGDVPVIIGKIAELASFINGILQDPDLVNLGPQNTAVRVLNIAVTGLSIASVVVAALYPPATPTPVGVRAIPAPIVKGISPKAIVIELPKA